MAAAPKIELLISDVDGTLVTDDKILTERTRRAVEALDDVGIRFAITSSRPPRGMASLVAPLRIRTPIAGFNGGIFAAPDQTVLEASAIEAGAARRAADVIAGCGLDVWVYTQEDWLVRNLEGPRIGLETMTIGFPPQRVADFGDALGCAFKIVGVGDDPDRVLQADARMRDTLAGAVTASRSQSHYVDVTSQAANKGAVVDYLSRHLDVDPARIMAIGDGHNDIRMFERAGFAVAMGNAAPEVKAVAAATTDSNADDGFAKAVERLLLGREAA